MPPLPATFVPAQSLVTGELVKLSCFQFWCEQCGWDLLLSVGNSCGVTRGEDASHRDGLDRSSVFGAGYLRIFGCATKFCIGQFDTSQHAKSAIYRSHCSLGAHQNARGSEGWTAMPQQSFGIVGFVH